MCQVTGGGAEAACKILSPAPCLGCEGGWRHLVHTIYQRRRHVHYGRVVTQRGVRHSDHGGQVEGGHEDDQQTGLDSHRDFVGELIHNHPVEESARAVEDRGDGSDETEEAVISDESLSESFVVSRDDV